MNPSRNRRAGGGWPAIRYSIDQALRVGPWKLWKKMRSANACKTCAVGMGGQQGGMVNEAGHFPEVCKKSLQAQVADMIGGIPDGFFERNSLQELLQFTPKQAEDAGRLTRPLLLEPNGTHFKEISWDVALNLAANALRICAPERAAFYASGRSSNEAAFLLQSFARVFGSANVMNCSFYCHQASGVALKLAIGSGTATIDLDDLSKTELVVLIGANPASNHPRLMTQLADLRARGGKVVVINPIREKPLERFHVPSQIKSFLLGSQIASLYIQPLAGGDVPLLVGVLKHLQEKGLIKQDFLESYTSGWAGVLDDARGETWERIVAASGVPQPEIEKLALTIGEAKSVVFAWAMGLTHHQNGVDNILALCNVALATANIGREGAGLLPIRGHSNVQGIGSIGFAPSLQDAVIASLERAYGKKLPTSAGYDTYGMIDAAHSGNIDFLFALGGNLWGSNPASSWAADGMQRIGTTVFLSTKLNPGHFHGRGKTTLIVPVLARDEEKQSTTQESMFNFVRLSDGGEPNVGGDLRAEAEIICDLASKVLGSEPVDWQRLKDHDQVRKLIAETIPGWSEIKNIAQTKKEFTLPGRIFHQPKFNTADGKAVMHRVTFNDSPVDNDVLRLITLRSEGQFNTVVYEEYDFYRGVPHRHCILISEEDARKRGVKDGQRVSITGEAGRMDNIEVVVGPIRTGVAAMYYPEANVLINANIDERSRTPAFKNAPVRIVP